MQLSPSNARPSFASSRRSYGSSRESMSRVEPNPKGRPRSRESSTYRLGHDYLVGPLSLWLARDRTSPSCHVREEHHPRQELTDPGRTRNQPIDLNTASELELRSLPGVGPVIAHRIIEARPWRSAADLLRIKGIDQKRLERLQPLIRL